MPEKVFKVVFTQKAVHKLNQIVSYYEREATIELARKVKKRFLKASSDLKRFPESKPILPDTEDFYPQVRYMKLWSYKIIFTVFKKAGEVTIITIRHDKENPEEILDDLG